MVAVLASGYACWLLDACRQPPDFPPNLQHTKARLEPTAQHSTAQSTAAPTRTQNTRQHWKPNARFSCSDRPSFAADPARRRRGRGLATRCRGARFADWPVQPPTGRACAGESVDLQSFRAGQTCDGILALRCGLTCSSQMPSSMLARNRRSVEARVLHEIGFTRSERMRSTSSRR